MRTVNPVCGPKAEIISTRLIPPPADLHSAGARGSALIRSILTSGNKSKRGWSDPALPPLCYRPTSVSLSARVTSRWGGTPPNTTPIFPSLCSRLPQGPPSYLPDKLPSRTNAPPRTGPAHIWEGAEVEEEEKEEVARLNEAFTVVHLRATRRPVLPPRVSVCKSLTSDNFINSPLRLRAAGAPLDSASNSFPSKKCMQDFLLDPSTDYLASGRIPPQPHSTFPP